MWCLTAVLLAVFLCIGNSSPLPDYLTDSGVPGNTGLRPIIVKQSQSVAYTEDRGGRALTTAPKIKPERTCSCPRADGWTHEQLINYKKRTNLTGSKYDCFCYGPDGYFLIPRFLNYEK